MSFSGLFLRKLILFSLLFLIYLVAKKEKQLSSLICNFSVLYGLTDLAAEIKIIILKHF